MYNHQVGRIESVADFYDDPKQADAIRKYGPLAPSDENIFGKKRGRKSKYALSSSERQDFKDQLFYYRSRDPHRPLQAQGFIPNYIKSRVGGRDFSKLSVALANFNRRNMIMPPVKALSGQELLKYRRSNVYRRNNSKH